MKLNKSPGGDGLSIEFYRVFWPDIKYLVISSLNEAYTKQELSYSQRRGIITLIYKNNDKTQLSNWCLISLLNTDYKLLAHMLQNRLKNVLDKLISPVQTGYIKGRFIGQNIRVIQDWLYRRRTIRSRSSSFFWDFKKAFDTINHDFLLKPLDRFNIGDLF